MGVAKKRKFRLLDAVLASVCIVLVVESAAPAAAIGNTQYIWWIAILLLFFLPYGLISSELGTTYKGEGGLYDWVKRAFGRKNGARVAWFYWINFPLWMASLSVLFTTVMTTIFPQTAEVGPWLLAAQLGFIWFVIFASNFRITDSKYLINSGAIIKALIMIVIGGLGVYALMTGSGVGQTKAVAGGGSLLGGLSFVAIILFNFMGFEVVASFADDMEKPEKEIPKALALGGALIAAFYLFAAFGMGVAVPASELSLDSGLIDSFALLVNQPKTSLAVVVMGVCFMYTMLANLISWSPGINYVAMYAARDGSLPKMFASANKNGMPKGVNIINGVLASVLVVIAYVVKQINPDFADYFWTFFALNVFTFLMSYVFLFPTFLKLRKIDPDKRRPFKVKGGSFVLNTLTYVPLLLLVAALIFTCLPYDSEISSLKPDWALISGAAVAIAIGEVMAFMAVKRQKVNNK